MSRPILDGQAFRATPPQVSAFAALVEQVDRTAFDLLGGASVIYRPAIGAAVPVTGMFDEQYVLAKGDAHAGVEATLGPAFFARLADLPVDPEQDEPTLTIGQRDYHVIERKPDGLGGILLVLRQVV